MSRALTENGQRSRFLRFGIAFLAAVVALLISVAVSRFASGVAYLMAVAAVAFSSWYCGMWPSVLCTAISVLGAELWFVRLAHSNGAGLLYPVAALFTAGVIIAIGEANRRQGDRLRDAAGELEEKVRQRARELDTANQSLRELTARVLNLQDEERRRIARELHDNAGQALSVLAINLSAVANDLGRLVNTVHTVKDSAALVHQMSDDIRTMSYLLHPPMLDEMGLVPALEWYVRGFADRSKIAVQFDCARKLGRFLPDVEIAAFRVVQESLTNIHRHSGSAKAVVQIAHSEGHLELEISDSGKGISADKREQMASGGTVGVGIRGMRERIQQLGGSLNISSSGVGTGTRVVVRLPAMESTPTQAATVGMA